MTTYADAPPWATARQPAYMPGCEVDHLTTEKCVRDGEDEGTHDGSVTCNRTVRDSDDILAQVTRSASGHEDGTVVISLVRVYWYVPAHDHEQDMSTDRARRLMAELVPAVEQAAGIADQMNAQPMV